MLSSEITLKQFICPIITCQQDTDLETLITHIQSSTSGIVAITNERRSPLGIVHSRHLLSLVSKKPIEETRKDTPQHLVPNYAELITSAPVVSAQLKIKELLPHLNLYDSAKINQIPYLVVDAFGKLLGAINTNKLLAFLLTETNNQQEKVEVQSVSFEEELYRLLDKIPLPIILKSKQGNTLYQNIFCYTQHCSQGDVNLSSLLHNLLPQPLITELSSREKIEGIEIIDYQKPLSNLSKQSISTQTLSTKTLSLAKNNFNYLKLPLNFTDNLFLESNSPLIDSWLAIQVEPAINNESLLQDYTQIHPDNNSTQINKFKNEFLLHFGHDLKSPLTAIVGLSRILKSQHLGELTKRQLDYINLIYRSGQKLMTVINDLLDISRIAAVKSEINLESCAIKEMCQEVYQQISNRLKLNKTINNQSFYSQIKTPPNLEINTSLTTIFVDRVCFKQILHQLLNNALRLNLNQEAIGIKVENWQRWVGITVCDRGKEIPETQQIVLLGGEVNFKEHHNSANFNSNFGLIFAQKLARIHGGDISFISTVDKGNKFTIVLPKNLTEIQDASKTNKIDNLLVLIVETVSSRIEYLSNKLKELGYYSVIARTLEDALYKAIHLQPAKIILNNELSTIWNQNIITLLRNQQQTKNIPVFTISFGENRVEKSFSNEQPVLNLPLTTESLVLAFPPIAKPEKKQTKSKNSLTILRLLVSLELKQSLSDQDLALDFIFSDRAFTGQHRIIEADSLEQANILARIWDIDAVILDGSNLLDPLDYLLSLKESNILSKLPLITLDAKITAVANRISGLSVFPCLVPSDERSITELIQVIQIATGLK